MLFVLLQGFEGLSFFKKGIFFLGECIVFGNLTLLDRLLKCSIVKRPLIVVGFC